MADVYANIMAGTNVTIDRGTTGEITVSSVGHDGVANALTLNINGSVLTVTIGRSNGLPNLTQSITLPDSGGGGGTDDGVISDIAMANSGIVTVTRTVGTDITNDFSTAINALIASRTNAALSSAAFNAATRVLTFGTLGGSATTVPVHALNEFHGVDPSGSIAFEGGDTIIISGVLYFYTSTTGANIQASSVATDNRFVSLALIDSIDAAYIRGLLHLTNDETNHLFVGVSRNGRRLIFDRNNAGNVNIDLPIHTVAQLTNPSNTDWGFVNGEVFTGAVEDLERDPLTYYVGTVGGGR